MVNATVKNTHESGKGSRNEAFINVLPWIKGTPGPDELFALGNDFVYGADGDDTLDARLGKGRNWLLGGRGDDQLFAKRRDTLFGGPGDDFLDASADGYNSFLYGGSGDDTFILERRDRAFGGDGEDTFYLNGIGGNRLWGGDDEDVFWLINGQLPTRPNRISDFDIGEDTLAIARVGVTEVRDLTFVQRRRKTLVLVDDQVVAKLANTDADELQAEGDFSFTPLSEVRSLDGSGNNLTDLSLGQADTPYSRVAPASYADGVSEIIDGPEPRYVSNRIFNDNDQNLFSENGVTQWAGYWGQFIAHTFGLRASGEEALPIGFDVTDPLEDFQNELGSIRFQRSAEVRGTGDKTPREQLNTISSYIDGWAVYGGSEERLEWLREGPVDGDLSNNSAYLLTDNGYLPRASARGDLDSAPSMELQAGLRARPERAVIAGDIRANENIGLTSIHTLFVLEHNRIVDALPEYLDEEIKFQLARKVVTAQQQYITYTEFLPAMGVGLDAYEGYDETVDPTISNEFATVGFRGHSMIHGEFEVETEASRYSAKTLAKFDAMGIEVEVDGDEVELAIPINVASGNPDLLSEVGLDLILAGMGGEAQYKNDEQLDNQLRSILFQIPIDTSGELDGPNIPESFSTVLDLGAIDIMRARDHGIPLYNDLREAYGLERVESFTDITGEDSAKFPRGVGIDDEDSLLFTELRDRDGNLLEIGSEAADGDAVTGVRATPLAARLKAIYGSVDQVDAFVGMIAEAHLPNSEFGELQHAMWKTQFEALRDGDRFFHLNDPDLETIEASYGITYQHSLAELITMNTDLGSNDLQGNVFYIPENPINT